MKLDTLNRTTVGKTAVGLAILLAVLQLLVPNVTLAQSAQATNIQTFEIKIDNDKLISFLESVNITTTDVKNDNPVTVESQLPADPCEERREKLYAYFTQIRPSRFANHVETLACQENWRRVTAIAFVESTLGQACNYNNCWGITRKDGKLARYKSLDEGIVAHNDLIARRYANKTYQQMNCIYVVPCNPRWLKGALQIEKELDLHIEPRS